MTHSGAQHTHSNKYTHTLLVYGYLWTRSSLVSFHRKPRVHLRTFQSHSFNYTLSVKSLIALMSILIVPNEKSNQFGKWLSVVKLSSAVCLQP